MTNNFGIICGNCVMSNTKSDCYLFKITSAIAKPTSLTNTSASLNNFIKMYEVYKYTNCTGCHKHEITYGAGGPSGEDFVTFCEECIVSCCPEAYEKHVEKGHLLPRELNITTMDWFCSVYVKEIPVVINGINIHENYEATLSKYGKEKFDPFVRQDEISIGKGMTRTSPGQICFLNWAIKRGVFKYCKANLSTINDHMMKTKAMPVPSDIQKCQ